MSDNAAIAERLAKLIKEVGINKSQFARAIGINVAYAHQILSGNRVITEKTFSKIKLGIPALNLDYIRTGQGNPLVSNLDLTTLKDNSKKPKGREEAEMVKKSVVVQPEVRFIPLVSTYTCADFLEGRMANLEQLPILGERKGFELAFRLEGNNMAERLNHGAVVICRSVDEKDYEYILTNTQVAYVVVRGSTFGVYYLENQLADHQQFVLHSHNSGPFPPLVAKREQIRGIYRVLAVQQDLD